MGRQWKGELKALKLWAAGRPFGFGQKRFFLSSLGFTRLIVDKFTRVLACRTGRWLCPGVSPGFYYSGKPRCDGRTAVDAGYNANSCKHRKLQSSVRRVHGDYSPLPRTFIFIFHRFKIHRITQKPFTFFGRNGVLTVRFKRLLPRFRISYSNA